MNELIDRARKVIPGGVNSPVRSFKSVGSSPIFFKRAQGAYLYDVQGKEYVDFCQSFGPNILGHRDEEVAADVAKCLGQVWTLGACEPYSLELAEWICQRLPWVEKIRFVCSGTEAVMSALRVARAFTGRDKILKFAGCYHGHADSMLVKAGSGLAGESAQDSAGLTEGVVRDTLVAPLNDVAAVEKIFATHGKDIAAVILEPLPANYGLLVQDPAAWKKIFNIAKSFNSLVIFDEVISGFRVECGGMAEVLDFTPDLLTFGKVIGGGFPVGAFAGRREILDLLAPEGPVYQAGTLAANPVGMIAGLSTLQKLERVDGWRTLSERTEKFCVKLNQLFASSNSGLKVSHFASLFWIHAACDYSIRSLSDIPVESSKIFARFFHKLLEQGVYLAPSGYEVSFMSLAHTDEVLAEVLNACERALAT